MPYIIKDEMGYWCGQRRKPDKSRVHFWSTKRRDAAVMDFYETAQHFAATLPQPVRVVEVSRRRQAKGRALD